MNHHPKAPRSESHPFLNLDDRYEPARHGIIARFPISWQPYAELARLDKPGFALMWIVHFCGILQASILNNLPVRQVLSLGTFFLPACQVLMCFNFAWNDTCDAKFDRQVLRTRHRPLARRALTFKQALVFDSVLAFILALFLLPLPLSCAFYAMPLAFGCLIYPLTKRFTNYPQACLGIILAGGVYMGAAAAGLQGLPYPARTRDMLSPTTWTQPADVSAVALTTNYWTIVVWVIFTETVYSYQDAEWDEAAGVGTITRIIPNHTSAKIFLFLLAGVQVALLVFMGTFLQFNSNFWLCLTCATALTLMLTIVRVDLKNPENCLFWFQTGNMITGVALISGYIGEYVLRNEAFKT